MLGGILAQTPMTMLMELFNWHEVLFIYASIGIIFLATITIGLSEKPSPKIYLLKNFKNENYKIHTGIAKIKLAIRNRQTWLAGLYICLFNLPVPLLGATWGSLYLTYIDHLSRVEASNVISMLFFGIMIGGPLFGWWSDSIGKRRLPMLLGGFCALITTLLIINFSSLSGVSLMVLFFLLGLFSSTQAIGYSVITESNTHSCSTALSIASLLVMGGGAIAQPFFGWLMDYHWHGSMNDQARTHVFEHFSSAILILPISFFIGLLVIIFLKDSHCQSK